MDAQITHTSNAPLRARRIRSLRNDRGETICTDEEIYLCRCGQSKTKPYCDGSHEAAHFSDKRLRASPGTSVEFPGQDVTVVDNFSLCAHAGECVDRAAATFFTNGPDGRVSHPDASSAAQVISA